MIFKTSCGLIVYQKKIVANELELNLKSVTILQLLVDIPKKNV